MTHRKEGVRVGVLPNRLAAAPLGYYSWTMDRAEDSKNLTNPRELLAARIRAFRDEAFKLGDYFFSIPETGFHEAKTAAGIAVDNITFGAYADITAVENLGIPLGYTGFMVASDESDVDNVFWSGIDLRAIWTGIDGLSLSTHNNISFAKGSDKEWTLLMQGNDSSFFTLYNAIGATVTLSERFGINSEVGNVFSKTERTDADNSDYDTFWGQAKFITHVTENAEFSAGVRVDYTTQNDVDDSILFGVPVGITVSF
jgi:hypothetical protein